MAMEINSAYSNIYENMYAAQKQEAAKKQAGSNKEIDTAKQANEVRNTYETKTSGSQTTDKYIKSLQQKNPKLNILSGYGNGSAGSSNYPEKIDVTIAPGFLDKMASDPELASKYEKNLADIPAACKWGESMIRSMTGDTVYEIRFYIDENGNMSAGSVSGPSQKRAVFERSRKRAQQQKDDFNKRLVERIKSHREDEEKMEQLQEKRREAKKVEAIKSDDKIFVSNKTLGINETYKPFNYQI